MEQDIIPESLLSPQVDTVKNLEDLLLIKETDEGLVKALLWDVDNLFSQLSLLWIHETEHLCERLKGSKAEITGRRKVFALPLKLLEERHDEIR